jgi:hypothetical protein
MTTLATRLSLTLALTVTSACLGVEDPIALDEPIVVHDGNSKKGKLPGKNGEVANAPRVTSTALGTGALRPGAQRVPVSGRVTGDAYSVGIRLLGEGTGYWVVPAGAEDLLTPGELTWDLSFDVGLDVAPGQHELGIVALDEQGRAGQQNRVEVCVLSDLPDRGNVCNAQNEPPAAIASLRWNSDADLDLIVIAPDGTRYSRSNFSQVVNEEVVARLDADGSSGCLLDGRRSENFVWEKQPQKGTWYVYANLFDACGKPSVSLELTTYRKHDNKDGTFALDEQRIFSAQLLRAQTNPDAAKPLYLTSIEFP